MDTMAPKSHWEIDPWDDKEIWKRVIAHEEYDPLEARDQARLIFGLDTGARCLEIGAGVGRLLKEGGHGFFQCVGVDSSISLVARSTRFLMFEPMCRVILTDGMHLPFPDGHFDFVYSFTCFQHMESLETIRKNLCEAVRVLRPTRKFKMQTVCGERASGRYDGYVFESTYELSAELFKAGFNEVSVVQQADWLWATGVR